MVLVYSLFSLLFFLIQYTTEGHCFGNLLTSTNQLSQTLIVYAISLTMLPSDSNGHTAYTEFFSHRLGF